MIYNKATSQPIIPWRSDKGDKPTKGIHNGSLLIEMDTATTYIFDAENKVWYPFGGKGSGGGGGSSVAVESLTVTENGTTTAPEGTAYNPVTVSVPDPVLETLNVSANGTYTPGPEGSIAGWDEVVVSVPADAVSAPQKDVNFIDYDGTVVYSYTATEFAALTAMPNNPVHDGLTSQGWNWSLSDAQTYVAKYGRLIIGQMYITDDGKTRIYIHLEDGRLSPYLGFAINGTAVIDWGDGSETNTVTGTSVSTVINTQHTYATAGDYVIIIDVTGSMTLSGHSNWGSRLLWTQGSSVYKNGVYQHAVQRVEIGSNITIGSNAFKSCHGLSSITIPNGVTIIEDGIFSGCSSLLSITIPDSVTTIGSNAFSYCYSLTSIIIPDSVKTIKDNAFNSCYSLTSITIPDSVKTIGSSVFGGCYILSSVTIPDSVTTIGSSAFSTCYGLTSITIPDSVKTIESSVFGSCYGLTSITIPDSVKTIGSSAFSNCYSLTSITIPDSVTTIKGNAFNTCYGLGFIRFEPTIPPTVANSNAFSSLTTDCIIYVPAGTLSDYTSATNYPSSSTYTYVEY